MPNPPGLKLFSFPKIAAMLACSTAMAGLGKLAAASLGFAPAPWNDFASGYQAMGLAFSVAGAFAASLIFDRRQKAAHSQKAGAKPGRSALPRMPAP